jgi:predicted transcriptional regulator
VWRTNNPFYEGKWGFTRFNENMERIRQIEVLKYLAQMRNKKSTIKEIADAIKLTYLNVHATCYILQRWGFVDRENILEMHKYSINGKEFNIPRKRTYVWIKPEKINYAIDVINKKDNQQQNV